MQLTGPPAINSVVRPNCFIETPVGDEWEDLTQYVELAGGVRTPIGDVRYLGRWTMGWAGLSPQDARALRSDLMQETVLFTPRTRADGDPDYLTEETYEVFCTTDLSSLQPLWRDGAWRVEVELEAVETRSSIPNRFDGGFDLLAEGETTATLQGYDGGTIDEGASQLVIPFDGNEYTIDLGRLGSDAVVAMRVVEVTDTTVRIAVRRPDPQP